MEDGAETGRFTSDMTLVFTDFLVSNKPVVIGDKDSPLEKVITYTESIVLGYNQSTFSFEFAVLNYLLPEQGYLSMHCSANMGAAEDSAILFGL